MNFIPKHSQTLHTPRVKNAESEKKVLNPDLPVTFLKTLIPWVRFALSNVETLNVNIVQEKTALSLDTLNMELGAAKS